MVLSKGYSWHGKTASGRPARDAQAATPDKLEKLGMEKHDLDYFADGERISVDRLVEEKWFKGSGAKMGATATADVLLQNAKIPGINIYR
jgi:hypothetical protein